MRALLSLFVASLLVAGCTQTLDVGAHDDRDADPSLDAGATRDGAVDDGGALVSCASDPILLVALRAQDDFSGDDVLARFALGAQGIVRCPDVAAGGALPTLAGIGWLDADRAVVGATDGLYVVDVGRDRVLGHAAFLDTSVRVIDAFGVTDASGEHWGVVSADLLPDDAIDRFYLLRASDFTVRTIEATDIDTRRLVSCDASPRAASGIVCVENLTFTPAYGTEAAAKEIHPFGLAAADRWIDPLASTTFRRIAALGDRAVWIADAGAGDEIRASVGALPSASVGPASACTSTLCGSPRELVDVVVDPTRPGGYVAICRGVNDFDPRFHVVRGSTDEDGAACEVLLDGTTLPTGIDPVALDVRVP